LRKNRPIKLKIDTYNTNIVIEVRRFKPIDTFRVIKLASITLTEQYNPSIFTYFYETYPQGFLVAEQNHKIIGFITGVKISMSIAKILMLSVDPAFQKKKIGRKLLDEFLKISIQENVEKIELEVRTDNTKAIKFYEKNGFKKVGKIKEFYQDRKNAYTMRLNFKGDP